ncbi:hypothetical protein CIW83_15075 [Tissierella sp. P1]|uniref:phage holin family protein n=1 Tax=Tissierella sp. P1 TaxID=1280483 RepID=UPI000BA00BF2|nr:phage holin family protein [Tissierella sp. P1]OZV11300.1 hypothetical protein CIW83_15075 [Tissierella sp. P1]
MEYAGIAIIPLLIGILEVLKKVGLKEKYVPAISVSLGIVIGIGLFGNGDTKAGLVQGIFIGLSAVGLYSGTKNAFEK